MIRIVCVGKIKEKYFTLAVSEYLKRLSKYGKFEIVEVADSSLVEKALKVEGERILSKINASDYVVTLEIEGKRMTSLDFASFIDNTTMNHGDIVFVIGGSYGLSSAVKARSNFSLSFSSMTFPHQLFRVLLLEQIYRAYRINNNESYHK